MADDETFGQPSAGSNFDNLPAFFGGESDDEGVDEVEAARRRFLEAEGIESLPQQQGPEVQHDDGQQALDDDPIGLLSGIDGLLDDDDAIDSKIAAHASHLQQEAQQRTGWNFQNFENQFAGPEGGADPAMQPRLQQPPPQDPNMAVRQVPAPQPRGFPAQYAPPGYAPPPGYYARPPPGYPRGAPMMYNVHPGYPPPYGFGYPPQQHMPPQYVARGLPQPQSVSPGIYHVPVQHGPQQGSAPSPGQAEAQVQQQTQPDARAQPQVQEQQAPSAASGRQLQRAPMSWVTDANTEDSAEPSPSQSFAEIQQQQAVEATRLEAEAAQQRRTQQSKPKAPAVIRDSSGRVDLDQFKSNFKYMPWRDLRSVLVALQRQYQAVDGQTKSRYYEIALERKRAGKGLLTAATVARSAEAEISTEHKEAVGQKAHAKFAKWSDERANLWSKTHHTLGASRKNDITRPDRLLHFDMDETATKSFGDAHWTARKIIDDAMIQILAIERCLRRIDADMTLANIRDPVQQQELESHRANLSNTLKLRATGDSWAVLHISRMSKGKRMIARALAVFDPARQSELLTRICGNLAMFVFSVSEAETADDKEVNKQMTTVITDQVQRATIAVLTDCLTAMVAIDPAVLQYFFQQEESRPVVDTLIARGSDAAAAALRSESQEERDAGSRWEATAARLSAALQQL